MSTLPAGPTPLGLLRQTGFGAFFWTQFSGAANDNLFKFALTVLVTYQLQVDWLPAGLAGLVIGGLFILPYVLFSAACGQWCDRTDMALMMRRVKNLEIAIMLLAAAGFLLEQVGVLLLCIFLMGMHSTLFGPVKYAYLPRALGPTQLVSGNGWVEMGTFVAILLGNMVGGLLMTLPHGALWAALACVLVALLGRWAAGKVPDTPAADPHLHINWNLVSETWRNLQGARTDREVWGALLLISWMWCFGAVMLSQIPSYTKEVLHGSEAVASMLMVVFSVGIGVGSLLCERLGRATAEHGLELGLVTLGALGMGVFVLDLYAASSGLADAHEASRAADLSAAIVDLMGVGAFLGPWTHTRILVDLSLLSLSAGLFSVPLYAFVQQRSPHTHSARVMAANNILNALFMVTSALITGALLTWGVSISGIWLCLGVSHGLVCALLLARMPQLPSRFWVMLQQWVKAKGKSHESI